MSLRETILSTTTNDLPREPVKFCGQPLHVRTMTGLERDAFETVYLESKAAGRPNIRGAMAAFTLIDDEGKRVFTDADAHALGNLPAAELDRVFEIGQRLNKMSEADVADLEGNSEATPGDGSTSN